MEFKGLSIIISASDLFVLIGWSRIGQGRVNELMDALKAVAFPKTGDGTRQRVVQYCRPESSRILLLSIGKPEVYCPRFAGLLPRFIALPCLF